MVGVVVVGPVGDHDVGLPLADLAGDRPAVLQRRQQLAVVDVQHLGLDAQDLGASLDLGGAAAGEVRAGHLVVADVAVGHADELDLVARAWPSARGPAGLELAVVGMGAEDDDPERAGGGFLGGPDGEAASEAAMMANPISRAEGLQRHRDISVLSSMVGW